MFRVSTESTHTLSNTKGELRTFQREITYDETSIATKFSAEIYTDIYDVNETLCYLLSYKCQSS